MIIYGRLLHPLAFYIAYKGRTYVSERLYEDADRRFNDCEERIVEAYASTEVNNIVVRISNTGHLSPTQYASIYTVMASERNGYYR